MSELKQKLINDNRYKQALKNVSEQEKEIIEKAIFEFVETMEVNVIDKIKSLINDEKTRKDFALEMLKKKGITK